MNTWKRRGPPRENANAITKRCSKCGEEKSVSEFDKRTANYADGTVAVLPISSCRPCRNSQFRSAENERTKAKHRKDRDAALRHYAIGELISCSCCGETQIEMLCLDHINNNGAEHRRNESGASSLPTYLRSRGFPAGYQVLCFNCNVAKYHYGTCPHQNNRRWPSVIIKPNAIVSQTAKIQAGTVIWHYTTICDDVQIGANCIIGSHCYIGKGTIIGNGTHLQTGVFLPNNVVIEESCFLGPKVCFTDDRYPRAGNKHYSAEPPVIRRGASIGAGAVLLPGVVIGENAMVAAGAVVTRNVEPGKCVIGIAARLRAVA